MKLIVAVDRNWAIGCKGKLLVSIPNDHKNFRELTTGRVVILGRKTLETFPQGLPLKNRTNIILSRDASYQVKDALTVHSIDELMETVKDYDTDDVFVIGGDSIYRQLVDKCDTAIVTFINHRYEADAYFPNLDEDPKWELTDESEEMTYFDLDYTFRTYKKRAR